METYIFRPKGVCSREMRITHENGKIINLEVIGGCNGNLKGIAQLVKGLPFEDVVNRLSGITCGFKQTSCPDQLAEGLKNLL